MAHLKIVFNPFSGKFDYVNSDITQIPEYEGFDPVSPSPEDTWVLHTGGAETGQPLGLLLSLTYSTDALGGYHLSYKTIEGTIKRVQLI